MERLTRDKKDSIKGLAILITQIGILSSSAATVIIGYNSERNLRKHNKLPEIIRSYDVNKDGYLNDTESKRFLENYNIEIK